MTRIEEIYENVLPVMKDNNIEDTPQHRLWALQGLLAGWKEDVDDSVEKSLYMAALTGELFRLRMELYFPRIMK